MAFDFSSFVNDQVDAINNVVATDNIIEKITPSQAKGIVKAGPKEFLDQKLEDLSGVKLGQTFSDVGAQFADSVGKTVDGFKKSLEAHIVGCLNKAIRDAFNKNPNLEKIIFFEQTINNELSKIRNKLESKIDAELRKLAYKKIKIQQVALFKQKILSSIESICPGASPASPDQVNDVKNTIRNIFKSNEDAGVIIDTDESIPANAINKITDPIKRTIQKNNPITGISNTIKKKAKDDPIVFEQLKIDSLAESQKAIIAQAEKQIKGVSNQSWEDLIAIS